MKSNQNNIEIIVNSRKRVCLTLDLKDNPELIEKYKFHHRSENSWPEINEGIRKAGILMMDIYLVDNRMFMICEIDEKDNFNEVWNNISKYPRQDEWFELMSNFIQAIPGRNLEWVKMERVFELPDN